GLAIVKHIVQAHDGEVTVHSTPGEGSVFTICLPVS
ncbi:MAG: ATP-binding protein, partial [Desulfuromonadales bacterium]|nr:ATP-binding protein [Desulfuromonadales bacterium]